eukprot:5993358-Amphidinium_carterae.1
MSMRTRPTSPLQGIGSWTNTTSSWMMEKGPAISTSKSQAGQSCPAWRTGHHLAPEVGQVEAPERAGREPPAQMSNS